MLYILGLSELLCFADSMWSPPGVQPLSHQKKDSMWTPHGVQ